VPPLNLVGDFGGGSMFLVVGVLSALLERQRSGRGQMIDCAMVDGTAYPMAMCYSAFASGA
jgi:alpha-methylacyl-CoA racemase